MTLLLGSFDPHKRVILNIDDYTPKSVKDSLLALALICQAMYACHFVANIFNTTVVIAFSVKC